MNLMTRESTTADENLARRREFIRLGEEDRWPLVGVAFGLALAKNPRIPR